MNMLDGMVSGPGEVSIGDSRFAMPAARALQTGAKLKVGIRPEDVEVVASGGDLSMQVDVVEELGAVRLLHGAIGGRAMTVQVPAAAALTGGGSIQLRVASGAAHPFDAVSGKRIG